MAAADLSLLQADRFKRSYRSAGIMVQSLVQGAVHDFVRRYRADRRQVARAYRRVRGVKQGNVLELDVAGGLRCVAAWNPPTLTLLDAGDHETVPRYRDAWLNADLKSASPAPPSFKPTSPAALRLFSSNPSEALEIYGNELSSEWLYYLDGDQVDACEHILDTFIDAEGGENVFFVVGGPGTGKTSVLLQLLKSFGDLDIPSGIVLTDQLAEYIDRSLPMAIETFRTDVGPHDDLRVLLVDDPSYAAEIKTTVEHMSAGTVELLVVAFDPLQLSSSLPDDQFRSLVDASGAQVIELGICYRQKQNVGMAFQKAAQVIAGSTPFLVQEKIADHRRRHAKLTRLSNGVLFANPHGYVDTIRAVDPREPLREQIERVKRQPLWVHWTPILVVVDDAYDGPRIPEQQGHWVRKLSDLDALKGLEFQHVFMILAAETFDRLEAGFTGSGRRAYDAWRLLRIPFSRGKDSFVTIVAGE